MQKLLTIDVRTLLATMIALMLLAATAPARSADGDLRVTLFGDADRALASANEFQASLLAPRSYGNGAENYRRAESILDAGGGLDAIQRHLRTARDEFTVAAAAAEIAQARFATSLDARSDAASADSERFAPELWQAAERAMTEAGLRLERGREDAADRQAADAEQRYREAELAAIQANYLNTTRQLLETADDLRARRLAPISYERASSLLAEAEQVLIDDRYDTDRPRTLAQQAEHNARHAIYVSRLEQAIRGRDTTLEQILLDWESGIASIGDKLDTPVYFDDGYADAVARINQAIDVKLADIDFLEQGVADRDARIASLEIELSGQTQSLARVNEALERRERQRERLERVERLFNSDQALVLRQTDSVILRLIGLNFASGSARLTAEHDTVLGLVQQALAEFPEANIVIEGHTDSFGSDATNQALSQERADAVAQYLLARSPISPTAITALGYGESRPVANNETAEGRTRNRRIDIVIYPKW
ncbi:MAG: OmpA family protein [Pseudomonadales bacterium]